MYIFISPKISKSIFVEEEQQEQGDLRIIQCELLLKYNFPHYLDLSTSHFFASRAVSLFSPWRFRTHNTKQIFSLYYIYRIDKEQIKNNCANFQRYYVSLGKGTKYNNLCRVRHGREVDIMILTLPKLRKYSFFTTDHCSYV